MRELRAIGFNRPDASQHGIFNRETLRLRETLGGGSCGGDCSKEDDGRQNASHGAAPERQGGIGSLMRYRTSGTCVRGYRRVPPSR